MTTIDWQLLIGFVFIGLSLGWAVWISWLSLTRKLDEKLAHLKDVNHQSQLQTAEKLQQYQQAITQSFAEQQQKIDSNQFKTLHSLTESLQNHLQQMSQQLTTTTKNTNEMLVQRVSHLNESTDKHLKEISQQVEKRLSEGFEKTTSIFNDVTKRLHLIDKAQQKITELSSNVVDLQALLSDRKSRGAFGEVQLNAIIRNMLPENHFSLQHTLSNQKRVDCLLYLPEPTGNVAIDAKFPLETYKILQNEQLSDTERNQKEQRFRMDIKKHVTDIAEKYIIPGETADGAVLFIPAEAIFAEIHSNYPDLVEFAHQQKVWLVSPTTLMAILTTARAVLKDEATRKQVHIIKEHLVMLAKDFGRFHKRMDNLSKHIDQAQQDVFEVKTSARKLTARFEKIEKVELDESETEATPLLDEDPIDETEDTP